MQLTHPKSPSSPNSPQLTPAPKSHLLAQLTLTYPSHPKDKEEVKDNEHLQRGIMEIFGNTENFHTSDNRERQYIASLLTSSYSFIISQKHIFTILTILMIVGGTNLIQIENHLDHISAHLDQPIIEGQTK